MTMITSMSATVAATTHLRCLVHDQLLQELSVVVFVVVGSPRSSPSFFRPFSSMDMALGNFWLQEVST